MKTNLFFGALLTTLALGLNACSDDFLYTENRDSWYMTDTVELAGHVTDYTIKLSIKEAKNRSYTVLIYPKWIKLESKTGSFISGDTYITLKTTNEDLFTSGPYIGRLVFDVEKMGYVQLITRYRNP